MYLRIFPNCSFCRGYKLMHPSVLPSLTPKTNAEDWDITHFIWKWQAWSAQFWSAGLNLKKKKKLVDFTEYSGLEGTHENHRGQLWSVWLIQGSNPALSVVCTKLWPLEQEQVDVWRGPVPLWCLLALWGQRCTPGVPGTEERKLKNDGALLLKNHPNSKKVTFLINQFLFLPCPLHLDHEAVGAISL